MAPRSSRLLSPLGCTPVTFAAKPSVLRLLWKGTGVSLTGYPILSPSSTLTRAVLIAFAISGTVP
eukprot:8281038-Prorocentrum_lima.AAC.1